MSEALSKTARHILKERVGNRKVRLVQERCPKCDGWGYVVSWLTHNPQSSTDIPTHGYHVIGCSLCQRTGMKEIAVLNTLGGR